MPADPTHLATEIRRQPASWMQAAELLPEVTAELPQPGERVAVIGCGTSWFMALAYASLREEQGGGETDAFAASEFPPARRYDRLIAISRSGTTTEVVRAIEEARSPVVALTAVPDSPVCAAAGRSVVLDFADEQSVVQTVFATTALMLLRASLGERIEPVAEQAESVLEDGAPLPPEVESAEQVTFLGRGWAYGVALEAALKLRETAQLWTEAYPQMEYRHGPIAIAEAGRAVWVFGRPVAGLAADIAATDAAMVGAVDASAAGFDPVADLVRVHLFAARRAERKGLDPDHPRHLSRSVVLDRR